MKRKSMKRWPGRWVGLGCALVALGMGQARAEDDLLATIYTDGGLEIRRDDRVFVLYAALNSVGYDPGLVTRAEPFPRRVYHPIRTRLMEALAPFEAKLAPAVEAYVDAHPDPLELYVQTTLQMSDAPALALPNAAKMKLGGLAKVLADYAKAANAEQLVKGLSTSYRPELKRVADVADKPFTTLREAFRLDEELAPLLVLVPNPLGAPDQAFVARSADDTHVVVFGLAAPGQKLDLKPALRAYGAFLAREETKSVPKALEAAVARAVGTGKLPKGTTARQLVAESLEAAVAARLWAGKQAGDDVDAAVADGRIFARALFDALAHPPQEDEKASMGRVLGELDTEQALSAYEKARKR